jgi:hypothetical protein
MKIKSIKKLGKKFHYKWSTHQPVIDAILEILNPDLIIELGTGRFSSPRLLKSNVLKTIHIDNDSNWINLIKKENANLITNKNEFRVHELSEASHNSILLNDITPKQLTEIQDYYIKLANEIELINPKSSMIFTDGFACCRQLSVNILTNKVDSMIFHDAEKPEIYGYNNLNKEINNTHDEYLLKTATSYTGFFIRKGIISFDKLSIILDNHIDAYIKELDISKKGFELIQI